MPLLPVRTPASALPEARFDEVMLRHPVPLPGGVSTLELSIPAIAARALQPRRIVEIGTATGRTTINLAYHAPDAEVLTLDLPPEAPATALSSGPDYRALGLPRPGTLFEGQPEAARIRSVLCSSTTYDWSPLAGTVDLMFIDGAHDLETVRQDTATARQVMRPGGLVFWHDYGHVAGVTQALNELSADLPLVHLTDTMLAMLRVPEA
ncbi:MAG: class I SAM-dependent methyltransferase [Gammaproteobacteria bacterium]|nr:class I SAM-dependent methyltransferase [Gammaproteobacteria bacterium]